MSYSVLTIDDPEFSDNHWEDYFNMRKQLHRDYHIPLATADWQDFKGTVIEKSSMYDVFLEGVILQDASIKGYFSFNIRNKNTENEIVGAIFDAAFDTIPDWCTVLLVEQVKQFMGRQNVKQCYFAAFDLRTKVVAENLDLYLISRMDEYILSFNDSQDALMKKWITGYRQTHSDLSTEQFINFPEKYVERLAELETLGLRDMPTENDSEMNLLTTADDLRNEEKWRTKQNQPVFSFILLNANNEVVAMSQTGVNMNNPVNVIQYMTYIDPVYRGRGLAKWLKAEMYMYLRKEIPGLKSMTTGMYAVNDPMQHINKIMGFKLQLQGGEYRIELGKIPF